MIPDDEPALTLVQTHVLEIFAETAYLARVAMGHRRRAAGWDDFDRVFRVLSPEEKQARLNEWRRSRQGRELTRQWMARWRAQPHVRAEIRAYWQRPEVKARARENERQRLADPEKRAKRRAYNAAWMRAAKARKRGEK